MRMNFFVTKDLTLNTALSRDLQENQETQEKPGIQVETE